MLYTRPGCHLCDVLKEELESIDLPGGVALTSVDVEGDPELSRRFGRRVPVLEHAGRVLVEGRVQRADLARVLREAARAWRSKGGKR